MSMGAGSQAYPALLVRLLATPQRQQLRAFQIPVSPRRGMASATDRERRALTKDRNRSRAAVTAGTTRSGNGICFCGPEQRHAINAARPVGNGAPMVRNAGAGGCDRRERQTDCYKCARKFRHCAPPATVKTAKARTELIVCAVKVKDAVRLARNAPLDHIDDRSCCARPVSNHAAGDRTSSWLSLTLKHGLDSDRQSVALWSVRRPLKSASHAKCLVSTNVQEYVMRWKSSVGPRIGTCGCKSAIKSLGAWLLPSQWIAFLFLGTLVVREWVKERNKDALLCA